MSDTYKGHCFCGAVEFEVSGAPAMMGYCHCTDCAGWAGAPVNAFSLFAPESLRVVKGADNIGSFNKTPQSFRKFCKTCGGHLYSDHPGMQMIDVYHNVLTGFTHEPTVHVFYGERTMAVKDGLPKFKDLPEQAGGSGEMLPE